MNKSVWIADPDVAFRKVELKGDDQVVLPDGTTKKLPRDEIFQVNPAQFDRANDIAELTFLNEASVVNNLSTRYANDEIYTYSGLFLVAVNPYKQLPIYGPDTIASFKSKSREESTPHIYAVAEEAYRRMLESRANQSILITGESGAGKTENTKKTIQYLSAITRSTGNTSTEDRILQTNPVLEAFGNAQTVRNNNSSRFGKFIRIEFSRKDTISGASIDWYLLEKSRVLVQSPQERNYHIFYYLLKGADEQLRKRLFLGETDPKKYAYLCGASTIEHVDDAHEFGLLLKAFKTIGFTEQEQDLVWTVVAAVLHLGNIEVTAQSSDQGRLPNMEQVRRVCKLLGVKEDAFAQILTRPKIKAGRELVQKTNSAAAIKHSINSLAMSLYERLFGYIVQRLNGALNTSSKSSNFIGVLDIAGFEIFENNSFEQLCINYTNEKLQQFFNHHMFVLEQAEYVKEEIEWDYVDYGSDLQPTIDLIEKANPMGIFACLDEDCVMPRTTDASFTEKLAGKWTQSKNFRASRLHQGFVVKHYAAEVEYATEGWLEKNKDPLNEQLTDLLAAGSNELAAQLAGARAGTSASASPTAAPSTSPTKLRKGMFRTVAQRHRDQLNELMAQLEATHPHFVRCIVPNTTKTPAKFENRLVLDQLRCNGVLEGIRIARSGFPNRVEFDEFRHRYQALLPRRVAGAQEMCVAVLKHLQLNPSSYKIGTTKVFFKNGVLAELEEHRDQLLSSQALAVQSLARGYLGRQVYRRQLFRQVASKQLAQTARVWLQHHDDPWWKLVQTVRPLLESSESKENTRKDQKIQRLQDQLHQVKVESGNKHKQVASKLEQAVSELTAAQRAHEKTAGELKALQKKHTSTATDLKALQEAHSALQQGHDEYKLKFTSTNKALSEAQAAHSGASEQLQTLQEKHAKLEASHAESGKHAVANKQLADAAQTELASVREQLATSKTQFSQRLNEYVAKLERADEDNKKLRKQVNESDCQSAKFERLYNELLKRVEKCGLKVDELPQRIDELREAALGVQEAKAEAKRARDELKQVKSEAERAQVKAKGDNDEVERAKDEVKRIQDELKLVRAEASKAKSELKQANEAASKAKSDLKQANEAASRAKSELKQANETASKAKDEALQAQAQLKQAQSEAAKAQTQLKQSGDTHNKHAQELAQLKQLQAQSKELDARHSRELADLKQQLAQPQRELADLKQQLVDAQRAQKASAEKLKQLESKSSNSNDSASLAELQAAYAQLKARTDPSELDASRKQCAELQAQVERLRSQQPQDYELQLQKTRSEKADMMAENSRLLFRHASGPATDHSAELSRIQKELKVLKLKLVKSERERKLAQANACGLDGVELLKERDAAVRNWEKLKGAPGGGALAIPKRRALADIDSNRIPSGAQKVIAELSDTLRDEQEAASLYRQRANDYQQKIEQAKVIMKSLQHSEERLSSELEDLKQQAALKSTTTDQELQLRNATIKRLQGELAAVRADEGERQALERMSALVSSLNEVTSERDALLAEKIKLEQRLRYEWAGQSQGDALSSRQHELQSTLKQTRRELSSKEHELEELRSNSDINSTKLAQIEDRLRAAEQRNLEQEEELERLRDAGYDANLKLKEVSREMAAVREENLRLEKRRQGTYFI